MNLTNVNFILEHYFLLFLPFFSSVALCVAYKPDGKEVAVSTLNGLISIFDTSSGYQLRSIEGRNDLGSGRSLTDQITAKKNLDAKYDIILSEFTYFSRLTSQQIFLFYRRLFNSLCDLHQL